MNNQCVPHWNLEDESRSLLHPSANQKKSVIVDDELVELSWRNGHIVMHNQAHRKPPPMITEFKQTKKLESPMRWGASLGNSSDLIQEDETTPWFQYPLDDSLDKDFCEFFTEMHAADGTFVDKLNKEAAAAAAAAAGGGGEKHAKFGITIETNVLSGSVSKYPSSCLHENTRLPAQSLVTGSQEQVPKPRDDAPVNFSHFSRPVRADLGNLASQLGKKGSGNGIKVAMGESSSKIVLSACGSNQVHNLVDISYNISDCVTGALARSAKDDVQERSPHGRAQMNEFEVALTSSSGGSGCSIGRKEQNANERTSKRMRENGEESESHSQEAEYKAAKANKSVQRSTSARRSRATEVHNLSERRRRDKINEKMRALQELIPHCNKSDKASMLDEAIQYLKSLQLQVQLMWMGSGMAPMMFPGVQQYTSCMGVGMGHANMPSTHSMIHMPRGPLASQSMPSAPTANHTPTALNALNFTTQMPEPYAHYLGHEQMHPSPQAINLYAYGSGLDHNTPSQAAAYCSSLPAAGVPPEKTLNGHVGDAR